MPDRREGSGCLVNASSFPRTHTQSRPRWRSWAKASALVRGCACASVKVNKTESHAHTGASKCAQNPRYIKILCACVCVCACVNKQVDTAHKHAQGSLFWMCACVADGFSTNIDMRTHTHTHELTHLKFCTCISSYQVAKIYARTLMCAILHVQHSGLVRKRQIEIEC